MRLRSFLSTVLRPFLFLVILGAGAWTLRAADPPSEKVLFEEDFADAPGKGWSWYREIPDHWKIDKERKELLIQPVDGWMPNVKNALLRDAPGVKEAPLAIEVHVNHVPKGDYEFAALMWYFDDKNFVVIRKGPHGDDGKVLSLIRLKDGKGEWSKTVMYKDPDVDLRLVVTEKKAQGWYRASSAEKWQAIDEMEMPSSGAAKIGLRSGNGEGGWVRFSKFRILQLGS